MKNTTNKCMLLFAVSIAKWNKSIENDIKHVQMTYIQAKVFPCAKEEFAEKKNTKFKSSTTRAFIRIDIHIQRQKLFDFD